MFAPLTLGYKIWKLEAAGGSQSVSMWVHSRDTLCRYFIVKVFIVFEILFIVGGQKGFFMVLDYRMWQLSFPCGNIGINIKIGYECTKCWFWSLSLLCFIWFISKYTAPLWQCKRTLHLLHMYLAFFWQILRLPCGVRTFVWLMPSKRMFAGEWVAGPPQNWLHNVSSNAVFIRQIANFTGKL